jgi:hypothetical protein
MRAPSGLWKPFGVHEPYNHPREAKRPVLRIKRLLEGWSRFRSPRGPTQDEASDIERFPSRQWPHF